MSTFAADPQEEEAPKRFLTRTLDLGGLKIGGRGPIRVQSMTNTDTRDVQATLDQVNDLAGRGCEIVRLAVLDQEAASALKEIRKKALVPLVADIHFDHRLALQALQAGIDGLRINPGNIGSEWAVAEVVRGARERKVPIRIGVNSGSIEKELLARFKGPTPQAMVKSALKHINLLEKHDFQEIKVSLKSSSVLKTLAAYRLLAQKSDYPLHIGITEAGTLLRGTVKSSVGIALLLWEGLGDTLRVSLTGDPRDEVLAAWEILRNLGLRARGPEIISCPTCGRTEIDLITLTREVERFLQPVSEIFSVAVMGCVVNGPGEAREADIGIAGGRGNGIIFRKGRVIRKVPEDRLLPAFKQELTAFLKERGAELADL
ncbi:MAG: flavodoxin-dependent (E)-4-hydroxy-3-methylbut-2-enyl-diphosphate synthase [Desulfohalobiaceae bacterium]|nr:flavodoxin-dependent (E)-4-hydroxy-3-methylbut-2-enyl-diphosphate synthase [Desulfohalobiaceae bacterium]